MKSLNGVARHRDSHIAQPKRSPLLLRIHAVGMFASLLLAALLAVACDRAQDDSHRRYARPSTSAPQKADVEEHGPPARAGSPLPDSAAAVDHVPNAPRFDFVGLPSTGDAQVLLSTVDAQYRNELFGGLYDSPLRIHFDGSEFYVYGTLGGNQVFITSAASAQTWVDLMNKFLEWHEQAKQMGVKLVKDIGTFSAEVGGTALDGEWYRGERPVNVTCRITSTTSGEHVMLIEFPRVRRNSGVDFKNATIVLFKSDVDQCLAGLSRRNIDSKVAEHVRQQEIADQFQ